MAGKRTPVSTTIDAVGTLVVETTATVRSGSAVIRFFGLAAPSRSNPSITSIDAADALLEPSTRSREIRTSEITGPPFCDRPVWSRPDVNLPSSIAAMPMICDTVTTPVPPTPGIRTMKSSRGTRTTGSGRSAGGSRCDIWVRPFCRFGGMTSRKEGQSPFTHE